MRNRNVLINSVLMLVIFAAPARAHLMLAQHGTLSFSDNAAFMAISIPISAFVGIDEDSDGQVTMLEFNRNRQAVVSLVEETVSLTDGEGRLELQGILLSPVTAHDGSSGLLTDITVMGRFNLRNAIGALSFENGLYGDKTPQQTLKMSATKRSDGYKTEFELTPANPARVFFLGTPQVNAPVQAAMIYRDL